MECNAARPVKCRPLRAAGLFAALCLAQGCGPDGPRPSAPADPTVALADAGAEPRRLLRHEAAPGAEQTATLVVGMRMGMVLDGADLPVQDIPALRSTLSLRVLGPIEDGALPLAFTIATVEIAGRGSDAARLRELEEDLALQNPAGIAGTVTRSCRGHARAVDLEIPRGARSSLRHYFGNLRQALGALATPLPEEAVGVGARWRAVTTLEMAGLKLTHSAEYCLQALAGDEATVAIDAILLAEPQTFPLPDLPPGARCELLALEGTACGELVLDLTRTFPVAGELRCVLDMRLGIHDPKSGPAQAMSHLEMRFLVER